MSDTRIDMTAAAIPAGVVDIDLRVVMASFKLIVPPNVRVINPRSTDFREPFRIRGPGCCGCGIAVPAAGH